MKTTSKIYHFMRTTAMVAGVGIIALPATTFAATDANAGGTPGPKTSAFCTELPTKAATITGQLSSLGSKASSAWAEQDQKLTATFQKVDQDVTADRQQADTDRQMDFTKLQAKATTDAQKQAVQTYETAVQTAVSTRRAAYDSARHTFRTSLQAEIDAHRGTFTSQLATFQQSVASAIGTAEASCASNPKEGVPVRTALQSQLKTARETYQTSRKDDEKVVSQEKQYAATRNAAFKAADAAFQQSMTSAQQALRQAFGKTTM